MPKYKYGDLVELKSGRKGKVVSISQTYGGGYRCRVELDCGHVGEYGESTLNHQPQSNQSIPLFQYGASGYSTVDYIGMSYKDPNKCPICNGDWKEMEHPIFGSKVIWKDCVKCNKTKEQIDKELDSEF